MTVENGTLSAFASSGRRGDLDGDLHAERADRGHDQRHHAGQHRTPTWRGNAGSGAASSTITRSTRKAPTATVAIDDAALNIGDDALVTITFSEAVTGFTNADVTAENGTLTAFAVGGRRGDLDGDLHAERADRGHDQRHHAGQHLHRRGGNAGSGDGERQLRDRHQGADGDGCRSTTRR